MTGVTKRPWQPGSWRELLGRERLGTSTLLAGGVALYATNEFLTISLLPSTVADIGGQRFYAWVDQRCTWSARWSRRPRSTRCSCEVGPRASYLLVLTLFGAGTRGCALAPTMELLLVARTVQGAAGGMLAGLGYAVINSALPNWLWTRASALVSAMWGVSVIIGPAMGGVFAQFGIWRWAFGSLAIATVAMAALVPGALPSRAKSDVAAASDPADTGLVAAAARRSGPGDQRRGCTAHRVGHRRDSSLLGVALVGCFLVVDRRARATVLPRAAFGPGPLKWMYVTVGLLMAATMVDMYVPLFGQRLAHMAPVAAGFLGAVLAVGLDAVAKSSAHR